MISWFYSNVVPISAKTMYMISKENLGMRVLLPKETQDPINLVLLFDSQTVHSSS